MFSFFPPIIFSYISLRQVEIFRELRGCYHRKDLISLQMLSLSDKRPSDNQSSPELCLLSVA